ncbi:hypothetical protein Pcinc_009900 [Petrolisthes cinctipes]|uniref:Tubulin-specific chaperone D n=1 Tax=Petrolisthes cinctipes TaxID=88211 RepID=A0AAE1KVW4_PETCI|nr:hypothetical protein Pcinc_009900 [Petrolisthes cinctipes]
MARAYHTQHITPYIHRLTTALIVTTLFDREVMCRRAGSAAFQEHVGRQGGGSSFPHGIDIMTTIDYFAVGNRTNTYLSLSVSVARYPEYTEALIDHLVERKVNHWDSVIRELTAKALHNLTIITPEYITNNTLVRLVSGVGSGTMVCQHGCLLSLAQVVHALSAVATRNGLPLQEFINNEITNDIVTLIPRLKDRQLYKGHSGEYIKQASAILIEKIALIKLPISDNGGVLKVWQHLLEEWFVCAAENIRTSSLTALATLWTHYYQPNTTQYNVEWRNQLIDRYIHVIQTTRDEDTCVGYTAALGCLPKFLARGKFDVLLTALLSTTTITNTTNTNRPHTNTTTWARTRQQAINSTLALVNTLGINAHADECDAVGVYSLRRIYHTLLISLDDYTVDSRGDIGSRVRETALNALKTLTQAVLEEDPGLISKDTVEDMMCRVCQQAVERINRTRKVAGLTFISLLYSIPQLPHIPCESKLKGLFPNDDTSKDMNWASEHTTFPLFIHLIDLPQYRSRVLLGITQAAGGIDAHLDMNWASEHTTFPLFIHLIDLPQYRSRVLLGITQAAGGIDAHLTRHTSEALHTYLNGRAS